MRYNIFQLCSSDLLAQLVEHLTFNQRALGPNPRRVTIFCCKHVYSVLQHFVF